MKKIYGILLAVVILFFVTALTHASWLLGFSVIIGSDWGYFFSETMKEWFPIHSIWNTQLNFGYYDFVSVPFLLVFFLRGLLATLHVDFVFIDRILYLYPIALLAPFSMFYLCYKYSKNYAASIIGALFYSLNTYILTIEIGHFTLAFVYAIFPVIFLAFDNFLKKPRYRQLLLLLFLTFLAFSNEARITFLGILILGLYFIFDTTINRQNYSLGKALLLGKYLVIGIVIFLGLLSFFIFPLIAFRDIGLSDVASRGLFGVDFFPIKNAFTLFHPFWSGTITTEFIPQPIPFYFWLFPVLVFSALFFAKNDKKIYFFASLALLGVFLGKGITPPLGNIYNFLYTHIFIFSFFREPTKFYFIIAFSYSLLLMFFMHYFFTFLNSKLGKKKLVLFLEVLLSVSLSAFLLFISNPAIRGTLADAFKSTRVPQEYIALKNFIQSQNNFFRIMYVPNRQRFEFLSGNHPSVSYIEIPESLKSIDPDMLKLYSVKYIILPYDSTNDIYRHFGPRPIWEKMVNQTKYLKKIDYPNLGAISIYENTKGYLPYIFAAENTIYVDGDPSLLSKIIHLMPDATKALYFAKPIKDDHKVISDERFKSFDSYYFPFSCIRCIDSGMPWENFYFPYASFLPDSPFYFFIQLKEQKDLDSLKKNQEEYLDKVAFYSLKRVIEIQKMISLNMHVEYIKQILEKHRELISVLQKNYEAIDNKHFENNDQLLRLADYVVIEKKILSDLMYNEELNGETKTLLQNEYYLLDDGYLILNNKILRSTPNTKKYILSLSQDVTGEILLSTESVFSPFTIKVDDVPLSPTYKDGEWISYGYNSLGKGKHSLVLSFENNNSLVATNSAMFSVEPSEGMKKFVIPLTHFKGDNDITVSFMYQVSQGKPPRFFLSQDADRTINGTLEVELNQFLQGDSGKWNKVVGKIKPKEGATSGNLEFWVEGDMDKAGIVQIKDLSVTMNVSPIILFRNDSSKNVESSPNIVITSVSPTRYQAKVTHASKPYMLIFNEQFHSGWRASVDGKDIPENDHIAVNGYANGWFIDKNGDYIVDIYFYSEKYYKIGIALSLLTVFIVICSLAWSFKKELRYEKNKS